MSKTKMTSQMANLADWRGVFFYMLKKVTKGAHFTPLGNTEYKRVVFKCTHLPRVSVIEM